MVDGALDTYWQNENLNVLYEIFGMTWATTTLSKKAIQRAGEVLIDPTSSQADLERAYGVMSEWRAAHAYPMHALLTTLRGLSKKVDGSANVVQRLKRAPSIQNKLNRFPTMKLHRMQDISGCRAILNSVKNVETLADEFRGSRTRHTLHRLTDYISNPKQSGYRGIHLVYKYNGKKSEYKDYFVEIQLRSQVQHAWATAVEIVDTFTHQAIKSSRGTRDWEEFFQCVSVEFAKLEKRPYADVPNGKNTLAQARRLSQKLNVVGKLNAFAVTTAHLTGSKSTKYAYYLLELTDNCSAINVTPYPAQMLEVATQAYLERESRAKTDGTYDVVLVSAESTTALKKAYPNYFADSDKFLRYLHAVMLAEI